MMKIFISDAVVSKGYDGAPAIRFFNSENGGEFAVFQVGNRKYDSREENNHRWVNLKIKAFGEICERIKKMGSPSRHPILQLDSLNRRRPLLLRLVPCLKALRATRVSVAGTIPISQAEYATGRANKI